MRAIIDLGTNTFHLLIAELLSGKIKEVTKLQIPVKIGEGGINNGFIGELAYQRGMDALARFHEALQVHQVHSVTAFGTSAIRDARNGLTFIKEAHERYGILIEAISGDEEAELIYHGVRHSFQFPDKPVLVMDIGGGSVEFIIGKHADIWWKQSFRLGAARLIEQFPHSDPIHPNDIILLHHHFSSVLDSLSGAIELYRPEVLIGSAGSFETLGDVLVAHHRRKPIALSENARAVDPDDFKLFYELITSTNSLERLNIRGMADFRVEMIVVATVMVDYVLRTFGFHSLICSDYSLKEGILLTR